MCEGQKTEPNYFKSLGSKLPRHLVVVEIYGQGFNTVSLVESAIDLKSKRVQDKLLPDYDEVYVVFDKDDFSNELFNNAVKFATANDLIPTYSNEAFELWYVLHFQYLDAEIGRKEYQKMLERELGKYEKNSPNMYEILQDQGDENLAIKRAAKLLKEKGQGNPAKEKPTTKVHELVNKLNQFKSK